MAQTANWLPTPPRSPKLSPLPSPPNSQRTSPRSSFLYSRHIRSSAKTRFNPSLESLLLLNQHLRRSPRVSLDTLPEPPSEPPLHLPTPPDSPRSSGAIPKRRRSSERSSIRTISGALPDSPRPSGAIPKTRTSGRSSRSSGRASSIRTISGCLESTHRPSVGRKEISYGLRLKPASREICSESQSRISPVLINPPVIPKGLDSSHSTSRLWEDSASVERTNITELSSGTTTTTEVTRSVQELPAEENCCCLAWFIACLGKVKCGGEKNPNETYENF